MGVKTFWWNKSRRAQSSTDFETWVEGGVVPTMNSFDNGDTRATTIIVMRNREGKPGGGKGPMLGDKSFTLATSNDQVLFEPPMVAYPISGNMIGRQDQNGPNGWTIGTEDDPMFTLTKTDIHAVSQRQVRRLTPKECERLQGFPDDWTVSQSDSARYKQMGNAVAVPVVDWLIKGFTN